MIGEQGEKVNVNVNVNVKSMSRRTPKNHRRTENRHEDFFGYDPIGALIVREQTRMARLVKTR